MDVSVVTIQGKVIAAVAKEAAEQALMAVGKGPRKGQWGNQPWKGNPKGGSGGNSRWSGAPERTGRQCASGCNLD